MKISTLNQTKQWLKNSKHPVAKKLFAQLKALLNFELPVPQLLCRAFYGLYVFMRTLFSTFTRLFFWTPLFKGRLQKMGRHLNLYGGLPYISGPLSIEIGDNCRVSGQSTFSGRSSTATQPQLMIGNNVDIGWMTTIAVGSRVVIADNVRIAGRTLLAGYPGHPMNAQARAQGLPETDCQVGDIILEKDVWLATGVTVTAGVRIGHGSIIAAGSVVTKDIPAMVLAGGIPARVIRALKPSGDK
ncbi:MAG: acetyltransferase-like isoleucine patch superfamily enzyme [Psychromonas sp.]|jgi:acetyltransferase-like isoleucine patch superfamily enzyme|uniref:acyltransferase n=1 Tax=Psychromonas sp. TaxID=1884585 RepID=UPI0039E3D1D7